MQLIGKSVYKVALLFTLPLLDAPASLTPKLRLRQITCRNTQPLLARSMNGAISWIINLPPVSSCHL